MTRFVHSADWQLGMTRHFLDDDAHPRFTQARLDAVDTIGTLAEAEDCGFVVVSGDVFDDNHVERRVVAGALDVMGAHPDVDFYLLPGNHDPLDPATVYRSHVFTEHQPDNVTVLDDTTPVTTESGAQIVGAPWTSTRPLYDLVAAATVDLPADDAIRVVVGHGAVETVSPDANDPAQISESLMEQGLAEGRFSYVALGDRHSTQSIGSTRRIWYAGAPEPTRYDENDPGNVLIVDLTGDDVSVEPRTVGTWRFVLEDLDLTGPADLDRLETFLDGIDDKARTILKLTLVGQLSLADKARLDLILEHHQELLGALEQWDRHSDLVVLPDDADYECLHLKGFARTALDELVELAAQDGDAATTARDALSLLYRLGVGRA